MSSSAPLSIEVPLPIEDFPLNGPKQKDLLQKIKGAPLVQIERKPIYPHARCYWNVAHHVEWYGGKSIQGWQILWLPGLYIEAVHHAVWLSPEDQLIDLSIPGPDIQRQAGLTTFSAGTPIEIRMDRPPLIENKYVTLNDNPRVKAALAQYRINNRTASRLADESIKNGWKWSVDQGWFNNKISTQLMVDLNDQLGSSFRSLHKIRSELLRDFF